MAAARDGTSSLVRMLATCRSTVRTATTSSSAIIRLVHPRATSARTSRSRGLSAGRGAPGAALCRGTATPRSLEGPAGGARLGGRGLVVAEEGAGPGDEKPAAGRLEGQPEVAPAADGTAQRRQCARCRRPRPERHGASWRQLGLGEGARGSQLRGNRAELVGRPGRRPRSSPNLRARTSTAGRQHPQPLGSRWNLLEQSTRPWLPLSPVRPCARRSKASPGCGSCPAWAARL